MSHWVLLIFLIFLLLNLIIPSVSFHSLQFLKQIWWRIPIIRKQNMSIISYWCNNTHKHDNIFWCISIWIFYYILIYTYFKFSAIFRFQICIVYLKISILSNILFLMDYIAHTIYGLYSSLEIYLMIHIRE